MAQAAEAALVSRTTAYRYFPTQESLLVELSVNLDVADIEELVAQPVDAEAAVDRLLDVLDRFNRHVRPRSGSTAPRSACTRTSGWRPSTAGTTPPSCARAAAAAGWRRRWRPSPTPCRAADLERLIRALSLVTGPEAMVVLYDVCHLAGDDALAVSEWAARTLLEATFGKAPAKDEHAHAAAAARPRP